MNRLLDCLNDANVFSSNPIFTRPLAAIFSDCGNKANTSQKLDIFSPINHQKLATVNMASQSQLNEQLIMATDAFSEWRLVPAPKRGELVRVMGQCFRKYKKELAVLISLECGKIYQESFQHEPFLFQK